MFVKRFRFDELNKTTTLLLLVIGIAVVAGTLTVGRYAVPHVDDAILVQISQNLYREGRVAFDLMGSLYGYDRLHAPVGRLFHVLQGAWLLIFGGSLVSARVFTLVGAGLVVGLVYTVGRKLYDGRIGLLAAAILLASPRFFGASHAGRQEVWVMAATMAILTAFIYIRRQPTLPRYLLLGLLTLVPVQQHLNGVWFMIPLALLIIVEDAHDSQGRRRILAFSAGALVASLLAGAIQLLPYPQLALEQLASPGGRFAAEFSFNPLVALREKLPLILHGWVVTLPNPSLLYPVMGVGFLYMLFVLISAVRLAYRKNPGDRLLVIMWAVSLIGFSLGMPRTNAFYPSLWDPLAALIAAAAIGQGLPGRWRRLNPLLVLSPLLAGGLAIQVWIAWLTLPYDYERYAQEVHAQVPAGSVVMGDGPLWFRLREDTTFYVEWYFSVWGCRQQSAVDREDLVAQLRLLDVEYVVFDGQFPIDLGCTNPITAETAGDYAALLDETCTVVGQVDGPSFRGERYLAQGETSTIYHCPEFSHNRPEEPEN